jgi:hypothetical protein
VKKGDFLVASRDVQETWFAFDCTLDDGTRIIDEFLEQAVLSGGERSFLEAMRNSTMRLVAENDCSGCRPRPGGVNSGVLSSGRCA